VSSQSTVTELQDWRRAAESLQENKNLLYFRQGVGLKFDKKKLAHLEKESIKHYRSFLTEFGKDPKALFDISSMETAYSKTYELHLKLVDLRTTKILTKKHSVNNEPVNWGSWRQFASATDDSKAREEVFDTFLEKSSLLAPTIRARFGGMARAMSEFGTDPLSNYLGMEGVEYGRLVSFVDDLGSQIRPVFRRSLEHYSREILGREAEYYDDYYFFRSKVFRNYARSFLPKVNPFMQITRTMAEMNLDTSRIKVDSADRKGKSASAFCAAVKIPTDVRLSYRKANPLDNFTNIFHEAGHGIHFSSIPSSALYEDKWGVPMGVAETFSIFFESLMQDRGYLVHKLGLPEDVAADLVDRFSFNTQFFATFYSANSIMKLRYWHDELSINEASELYADLTEKYMGIRYPGEYWLLHHVMPDYHLYSPSYLIATARAFELKNALASRFGERFWQEKESGKFLLELMQPGRRIDLARFSKLDSQALVKSIIGS
jgi:hypothetical protein